MGTHKLHEVLKDFLARHHIKMGRDKLHTLLKINGMQVKKKANKVSTTQSNHPFYKYPNRIRDLKPTRVNELWVSDFTYIPVGANFVYLYLIMDAFSRKIVGWSLQNTLHAKGAVQALDMALRARKDISKPLIHHSDRGVQYCSWIYTQRLQSPNIDISMTESGDPNENALAERVIRALKEDCKLKRGFPSFPFALEAITKAINAYNTIRPHASLNYLTPQEAYYRKRKQKLRWYPYKKVRFGNVQYDAPFR
ncbi:integrase core domain protein [Necator americanus]|uniref:Integrase core domain protein n=1 Tax=Necator americanus TaxID=51031 RepID=W2SX11_NECAM|nr:integrase core domain protein [Necator americanus]ETN73361.1 integrase core domain protein [Necator americanus]